MYSRRLTFMIAAALLCLMLVSCERPAAPSVIEETENVIADIVDESESALGPNGQKAAQIIGGGIETGAAFVREVADNADIGQTDSKDESGDGGRGPNFRLEIGVDPLLLGFADQAALDRAEAYASTQKTDAMRPALDAQASYIASVWDEQKQYAGQVARAQATLDEEELNMHLAALQQEHNLRLASLRQQHNHQTLQNNSLHSTFLVEQTQERLNLIELGYTFRAQENFKQIQLETKQDLFPQVYTQTMTTMGIKQAWEAYWPWISATAGIMVIAFVAAVIWRYQSIKQGQPKATSDKNTGKVVISTPESDHLILANRGVPGGSLINMELGIATEVPHPIDTIFVVGAAVGTDALDKAAEYLVPNKDVIDHVEK